MKKILLFFLLVISVHAQSQKTVTPNWVKSVAQDTATVLRAEIALKMNSSAFADSFNNRFSATSIAAIKEVAEYERAIADSSILLYSGGVWSIFDLSEALSATANNAINITYPDANTISFNDTNVLLLDPLTLEINGSNQLTVIGGTGGSVGNADSLGGLPASDYVTKAGINEWSTNLYSGSANVMRLGKSYNDKRFNNGAYSDVWNIDYVIPPYNLSADWLYSIEHRTDYFNDTLNTIAHSDIVNIDGTGTPIWKTNDVRIMGNEIAVNVGDLPDSVALNWSLAGLTGNKVILSEANKTAVESRFPMPVRGFEFKFGSVPNYIFPRVYSFFSDLTTNTPSLETAYHFYGQGSYPSYFGGNILTDGIILVGNDTVLTTGDGENISLTASEIDTALTKLKGGINTQVLTKTGSGDYAYTWQNASGGLNESQVNTLIGTYLDTASGTSTHTVEEIDDAVDSVTILNNRVAVLENTVTSLQNSINNILAALDTCGCSASTADNTPPLAPTSYVAIGGTSQTQYVTTWTDPVDADLSKIYWYEGSANDSTTLALVDSINAGVQTYTRTGRTANTTYWSAVKAVDDSGNVSWFSNLDSATTQSVAGAIPVIESFTTDSVGTSATITLTKPSGVQNGDLLLIVVASEDPTNTQQWNDTTNKPTGFTWLSTTIGGGVGTGQNDCQTHIAAFYRIADGSEGATVGVTSVGTGNDQVGYYLRLSGVYGASPIDVWDSPLDSTLYQTVDTIQIHSQTTNYDNELALVVCANDGGNYGLTVETAGWSAVSDNWIDDSEYGLHLIIGKKDMPTAGATGQCIIKNATKTPNGSKVGMILTIRSE